LKGGKILASLRERILQVVNQSSGRVAWQAVVDVLEPREKRWLMNELRTLQDEGLLYRKVTRDETSREMQIHIMKGAK
jgi:hypothetical protein